MSGTAPEPVLILRLSGGEGEFLESLLSRAAGMADADPQDIDTWIEPIQNLLNSGALTDPEIEVCGAAFGEMLSVRAGLQWRMLFDEHDVDFALQKPGTTMTCFPFSMIFKRAHAHERIDLVHLMNGTAATIREHAGNMASYDDEWERGIYGLRGIDLTFTNAAGHALLLIVAVGRLTADPRHLRLLQRKLETYRRYVTSDRFVEQFGNPESARPTIRLSTDAEPDAAIRQLMDRHAAELAPHHVTVDIAVREPQAEG